MIVLLVMVVVVFAYESEKKINSIQPWWNNKFSRFREKKASAATASSKQVQPIRFTLFSAYIFFSLYNHPISMTRKSRICHGQRSNCFLKFFNFFQKFSHFFSCSSIENFNLQNCFHWISNESIFFLVLFCFSSKKKKIK